MGNRKQPTPPPKDAVKPAPPPAPPPAVHLLELPIKSPHHQPDGDRIRRTAEGLAREIQNDVMASEAEVADAIEIAIRRFARTTTK